MTLADATPNIPGHQVSQNPVLAGRTKQGGCALGILETQDDLSAPVEALLTNVVQGLRRDWLATSAHRWSQLYPISPLANTRLEKDVTAFLRELFCSYSQLIAGLEMHLLEIEKGGVVREKALLGLQQLIVHARDLASYQDRVSRTQRTSADVDRCLNGGDRACDK